MDVKDVFGPSNGLGSIGIYMSMGWKVLMYIYIYIYNGPIQLLNAKILLVMGMHAHTWIVDNNGIINQIGLRIWLDRRYMF